MQGRDPDLELWQKAQQRDERAYDCLRRKYQGMVRSALCGRLYSLGPDDRDDLEQSVWRAVWTSLPNFQGGSLFSTWVVGIAKNIAYDWLRRRTTEQQAVVRVVYEETHVREELSEREVVSYIEIHEAIQKLGEPERAVIHARYFLQLTDEEMAERLGQPLGTVKSRVRAALQKMKKMMDGEEP